MHPFSPPHPFCQFFSPSFFHPLSRLLFLSTSFFLYLFLPLLPFSISSSLVPFQYFPPSRHPSRLQFFSSSLPSPVFFVIHVLTHSVQHQLTLPSSPHGSRSELSSLSLSLSLFLIHSLSLFLIHSLSLFLSPVPSKY